MTTCIQCNRTVRSICGKGSPMDGINGIESGWKNVGMKNMNPEIGGQRQGITQYVCPQCQTISSEQS